MLLYCAIVTLISSFKRWSSSKLSQLSSPNQLWWAQARTQCSSGDQIRRCRQGLQWRYNTQKKTERTEKEMKQERAEFLIRQSSPCNLRNSTHRSKPFRWCHYNCNLQFMCNGHGQMSRTQTVYLPFPTRCVTDPKQAQAMTSRTIMLLLAQVLLVFLNVKHRWSRTYVDSDFFSEVLLFSFIIQPK